MTTLLAASVVSASTAPPSAHPTLILVPSAWTSPSIFTPLLAHLGPYPVLYAQALPSLAPKDASIITPHSDGEYIRHQILRPLLDAGKTCVLVAHSYGTIHAMAAARGLSTTHRRRTGNVGGVMGVISLAGWIVPEGETAKSMFIAGGRDIPDWFTPDERGLAPLPPLEVFSDEASPGQKDFIRSTMSDSAVVLLDSKAPMQAFAEKEYQRKVAYVRIEEIDIFPVDVQDRMVERTEKEGARWIVKSCPATRYYPWLKEPGKVAELIKELVMEFVEVERGG